MNALLHAAFPNREWSRQLLFLALPLFFPFAASGYGGLRAGNNYDKMCSKNLIQIQGALDLYSMDSKPLTNREAIQEYPDLIGNMTKELLSCPLNEMNPDKGRPYFVFEVEKEFHVFCPYHLNRAVATIPAEIKALPVPEGLLVELVANRVRRGMQKLAWFWLICGIGFLSTLFLLTIPGERNVRGFLIGIAGAMAAILVIFAGNAIVLPIPLRDILFNADMNTIYVFGLIQAFLFLGIWLIFFFMVGGRKFFRFP